MFAQANSEHCRHKIFNADWTIDGIEQPKSLFKMIKNTFEHNPENVLSAYKDNAAVMKGSKAGRFFPNAQGEYAYHQEDIEILMKVETHNHPTAIAPFSGAATGSGGEIRDEGATGRGSKPKAGLVGFTVSNLRIPGFEQPWESDFGKPGRIVNALDIMTEGPLGGAAFNNEFGRPNLLGYFCLRRSCRRAGGADQRRRRERAGRRRRPLGRLPARGAADRAPGTAVGLPGAWPERPHHSARHGGAFHCPGARRRRRRRARPALLQGRAGAGLQDRQALPRLDRRRFRAAREEIGRAHV